MQRVLSTPSHHRPLAALTAATVAFGLLAGCAQTPPSPEQKKQALRTHIEQEKVPFWRTQQATLSQVMRRAPNASYTLVWLDLNEAERKQPVTEVLAKAMQHHNPQDRDASMIWLRWRIVNGNADSRYAYAYAHMLATTAAAGTTRPMLPEAAAFLYLGRLGIAMDGARCADAASPSVARQRLEASPAMAPLLQYIASGPAHEVVNARANAIAIAIEQVRGERPAQEWVCRMGAASMLEAINQGAEPQKLGERVLIDTDGVKPGFVGDEVKRQRQQAVMANQWQALVEQTR